MIRKRERLMKVQEAKKEKKENVSEEERVVVCKITENT